MKLDVAYNKQVGNLLKTLWRLRLIRNYGATYMRAVTTVGGAMNDGEWFAE